MVLARTKFIKTCLASTVNAGQTEMIKKIKQNVMHHITLENDSFASFIECNCVSPLPLSLLPSLSRGSPLSLRGWPGVGEWELAEDTGLARSAYISSESALRTELLLDEADDTDDTLLTDRDLHHEHMQ